MNHGFRFMHEKERLMAERIKLFFKDLSTAKLFIIIALASLALRIIFLAGLRDSPVFYIPIIDEKTYSGHALELVRNGMLREGFFWQGPFYPFFLAAVYSVSGYSILGVKIIQILVGAATSGLVFLLGSRLISRKAGIIAAAITAVCGPILFFETKLLATSWASLWPVVILLLVIKCREKDRVSDYTLLGICCGLSIITRGNFILFVIPVIITVLISAFRSGKTRGRASARAGVLTGSILLILIPASILSYSTNGSFSPLPQSGSLNIYLGNNPDTEQTLAIRPGMEWRELIREPDIHGAKTNRQRKEYFARRFRNYASTRPLHFIAGLGKKSLKYFSSREIPRNIDLYTEREFSSLYSILLWKMGGFGFPFGLILILAAIGLLKYGRNFTASFYIFLVFYPLSVIAVFVASRYRVPYLPVLAIPAAAGILSLDRLFRKKNPRGIAAAAILAVLIAAAATVPGPFPEEKHDYRAEMYCNAGFELYRDNRLEDAVRYLDEALRLNPGYAKGNKYMGLALSRMDRTAEAVKYFEKALRKKPESRFINYYLGVNLLELRKVSEAMPYLEKSYSMAVAAKDNMMASRIKTLLDRFSG